MTTEADPLIRSATSQDMADIEAWLRAEEAETGEGFFCNWSIIRRAHDDGDLYALVDPQGAVGFLADGRIGPDIAEVRPDLRGKGYGRLLASKAIALAEGRGLNVIEIDCAPSTSVPFWEHIGFKAVHGRTGNGGGIYAYMELPRRFHQGGTATYEISFYPEVRAYGEDVAPFRTYRGKGTHQADGSVQVEERAICFSPDLSLHDCVVDIWLDGERLFLEKAKRRSARTFGVERDIGSIYYMDRIFRGEMLEE